MDWPDFDQPERRCRVCGKLSDGAACVNGERAPHDGDFAICINCGTLSIYEGDRFRAPTDAERDELPNDALTLIAAIRARGRFE